MTYKLSKDDQPPVFSCPLTGSVIGEALAAKCFRGILEGVSYLHSRHIAHRDLKLDNILVTVDGVCKICDFGCCKQYECPLDERISESDCSVRPRSHVRDTAGTWLFWAPEICSADAAQYDVFAADIWAVGVCLWTALFGTLPFWSPTEAPLDIFDRIENCASLILPRILQPRLKTFLVDKLLNKEPQSRDSSAELLHSDWLQSFQSAHTDFDRNRATSYGDYRSRSVDSASSPVTPDSISVDFFLASSIANAKLYRQSLFKPFIFEQLKEWSLRARYAVYDRKEKLRMNIQAELGQYISALKKASTSTATNHSLKPQQSPFDSYPPSPEYVGAKRTTSPYSSPPAPATAPRSYFSGYASRGSSSEGCYQSKDKTRIYKKGSCSVM
jgi:serine/threonine protein kinase